MKEMHFIIGNAYMQPIFRKKHNKCSETFQTLLVDYLQLVHHYDDLSDLLFTYHQLIIYPCMPYAPSLHCEGELFIQN